MKMLGYETFLRRLNRINKNYYHKSREIIGTYKSNDFVLHVDTAPKDPFLPPGRMRLIYPFKWFGYPDEFKEEPMSLLLAHFISDQLSEMNSKTFRIYRPTNIIIKRTNCLVGKKIEIRFDYHLPSRSRHILSEKAKEMVNSVLSRISELRFRSIRKSGLMPRFRKMVETYEDQIELRKRMRKEGIAAFVENGSVIPRKKFTRKPMENAVPFSVPDMHATTLEGKHREHTGLAIYSGKTTLITGSNFQGKSTLLFGLASGIYNHVAGDGREFVLSEELPLANKESGRVVNSADISLFLKGGDRVNTLSASGSVSQMANMVEILKMGKGFLMDEDESAVNFLIRSGISHVKSDAITPFSEVSRRIGATQVIAAGALKEMEEISDDVVVLENFRVSSVIRSGSRRRGIPEIRDYKIGKIRRFSVEESSKDYIRFKSGEISLRGPIRPTIYERAQVYLMADLLSKVSEGMTPLENAEMLWSMADRMMKENVTKNYSMITKYQLYYAINRLPFIR